MVNDGRLSMFVDLVPGTMTGAIALNSQLVSINNILQNLTSAFTDKFGLVNSTLATTGIYLAQVGIQAADAYGQFEQSMKIVQMVSGQTKDSIDTLSQSATQFSIQFRTDIDQITEGLQTLGRAGLNNAQEQTEVLQNGLSTAKLEGRDLNGVLEELIQNTALLGGDLKSSQFGEQSAYVNNLLVGTSMTAPITTHDVSETLKYSGGIAAAAGANIESDSGKRILEDYMGTIASFAQKGVTGSIAGTALRAFFNKPATQDSSVVEGLAAIKLKPEDLWEDSQEVMKPVSDQIALIQEQMDALNIPTMDRLQIWSKIVGGKMGQQMMKLDASDIKTLTNEIQNASDAEDLATRSMKTYESNVKQLSERGAAGFRALGEGIVFFINPYLEMINGLSNMFGFITDNPLMKYFIGGAFISLVGKLVSRIRGLFGVLRQEIASIRESLSSLTQTVNGVHVRNPQQFFKALEGPSDQEKIFSAWRKGEINEQQAHALYRTYMTGGDYQKPNHEVGRIINGYISETGLKHKANIDVSNAEAMRAFIEKNPESFVLKDIIENKGGRFEDLHPASQAKIITSLTENDVSKLLKNQEDQIKQMDQSGFKKWTSSDPELEKKINAGEKITSKDIPKEGQDDTKQIAEASQKASATLNEFVASVEKASASLKTITDTKKTKTDDVTKKTDASAKKTQLFEQATTALNKFITALNEASAALTSFVTNKKDSISKTKDLVNSKVQDAEASSKNKPKLADPLQSETQTQLDEMKQKTRETTMWAAAQNNSIADAVEKYNQAETTRKTRETTMWAATQNNSIADAVEKHNQSQINKLNKLKNEIENVKIRRTPEVNKGSPRKVTSPTTYGKYFDQLLDNKKVSAPMWSAAKINESLASLNGASQQSASAIDRLKAAINGLRTSATQTSTQFGAFNRIKNMINKDRSDRFNFGGFVDKAGKPQTYNLSNATGLANIAKGLGNSLLNLTDVVGGPVMIAFMAISAIINVIQGAAEDFANEVKKLGENLSDAYSERDTAESSLRKSLSEQNPGENKEETNDRLLSVYGQMADDIANGGEEFRKKASAAAKTFESQYNEEKDDGSTMEKQDGQISEEQKLNENIIEQTGVIYRASAEIQSSLDAYSQKATDDWWGVDSFYSKLTNDPLSFILDNNKKAADDFSSSGSFQLTGEQKADNYPGSTEMTGLLLEDFKDAGGDWVEGLRIVMGDNVNDFRKMTTANSQNWLDSQARMARNMSPQQNMKLQQSMKKDKKTWQQLAKEIAKAENKQSKGKQVTSQHTQRIENLVKKLQSTLGVGFDRTRILQAASLQMFEDMYSVAQQVMVPLMTENTNMAAQTMTHTGTTMGNTSGTGTNTGNTVAVAEAIAAMVAILARSQAAEAARTEAAGMEYGSDVNGDGRVNGDDNAIIDAARASTDGASFLAEMNKKKEGFFGIGGTDAVQRYYASIYEAAALMTTQGMDAQSAKEKARAETDKYFDAGAKLSDVLNTFGKNYTQDAYKQQIVDAYLLSDIGEPETQSGGGSGSGSGSGSGGSDNDKDDNKKTKKDKVDLVICNKKELPKLNVNLFKKPPSFTVLNKNFKLRDIKVNTEDKPKAILSSIKNAIIDVQKRSDPKIIQDEAGEYDPVAATEGSSVPSGSTNTSTNTSTS